MGKITYLQQYTQGHLEEFADENGLNFEDDGTFEVGGAVGKLKDQYTDETIGVFVMNGHNVNGSTWRCVAVDRSISQSGE